MVKQCPKCHVNLHERVIGPKKRLNCPNCDYLIYVQTGREHYPHMIEKILDGIVKKGQYDIEATLLANTCFPERYGGHPTAEQVDAWCNLHELDCARFEGRDAIGKKVAMVRFMRRAAKV